MGGKPTITEMPTGPIVAVWPRESKTTALNVGDVFNWALLGVQVKVLTPSNAMPAGMVPGATVTVSPLGALVCTV